MRYEKVENFDTSLNKLRAQSGVRPYLFLYVGKIPYDQGFRSFPTVPDFADITENRQTLVPDKWKVRQTNSSPNLETCNLEDW